MPNKKVIVTSGGTKEKVDDFRLITNVSSGALGAIAAAYFSEKGWDVDFVQTTGSKDIEYGRTIVESIANRNYYRGEVKTYTVYSAQDAFEMLELLVPKADAIVHAMAVADFGFKKDEGEGIKLKSDDPEALIEYMRQKIVLNPKIITHFREWNKDPNFFIVAFKFEINRTFDELLEIGFKSLERNQANLVVVNDKKMMREAKTHCAILLDTVPPSNFGESEWHKSNNKVQIVEDIFSRVDSFVSRGEPYYEPVDAYISLNQKAVTNGFVPGCVPICKSESCHLWQECKYHASAGDYRTEDGVNGNIRFSYAHKCWVCDFREKRKGE